MIDYFYNKLINITDLKPKLETNNIFEELCSFAINENNQKIKIDKKVREINNICSIAEYELEKYRCEKIYNSKSPKAELLNFIYYNNYKKLTDLEIINSENIFWKLNNILFVWWWPLPLTAILIAINYNIKIKIIDKSIEAVNLSSKLIKSLNLESLIEIQLWDALNYKNTQKYDLCYIASLVFWNNYNKNIIKNIICLNINNFLIRTSDWNRQLLYKKTNEKVIKEFFNTKLIIHPKDEIINSFILLTKK